MLYPRHYPDRTLLIASDPQRGVLERLGGAQCLPYPTNFIKPKGTHRTARRAGDSPRFIWGNPRSLSLSRKSPVTYDISLREVSRSQLNPAKAAMTDASSTAVLTAANFCDSKASPAMNSETVKPMPASIPSPVT